MTHPLPVQRRQPSAHLVHVQLHNDNGDILVVVGKALNYFVNCFRDVLQHKVQVGVIFFDRSEAVLEGDDVWMGHCAHYLELAVLESSVLEDLFYCDLRYACTSCLDFKS